MRRPASNFLQRPVWVLDSRLVRGVPYLGAPGRMGHQQRPKPKDHRPRGGPQQRWSRLGFGGGGVDLEGKGGDRGLPHRQQSLRCVQFRMCTPLTGPTLGIWPTQ